MAAAAALPPNIEGAEEVAVADGAAGVVVLAPPNSDVGAVVLEPAAPKRPPGCELGAAASGALLPNSVVVAGVFAAPVAGVVELPEEAGLAPNKPPEEAGCPLAPPNKPPPEAGCEPPAPPNMPPLLAAGAAAGVLEAGAGEFRPPKSGFCSAGFEAALPNRAPPVAGVEEGLFALPKEKLGVPVALPNRLVVGAAVGVDDALPKRPPGAGAVEVVALLAWPAELLDGVPKVKDMMARWLVALEWKDRSSGAQVQDVLLLRRVLLRSHPRAVAMLLSKMS